MKESEESEEARDEATERLQDQLTRTNLTLTDLPSTEKTK